MAALGSSSYACTWIIIAEKLQRQLDPFHLHPSFDAPDRTISDAAARYELTTAGWGQFSLRADVYLRDRAPPLPVPVLELLGLLWFSDRCRRARPRRSAPSA